MIDPAILDGLGVKMAHFRAALAITNHSTLRDTLVEVSKVGWDDIGGLEDVKKQLKELI